jgi:3-isopropylmalate/(R)-2-methylmalate dehydratase small subunit
MSGRAWVFGDNLDTDVLAPGKYMKFSIAEIATHCLEDVRADFASLVQAGDVVVGGRNFGVGSSREQAPQALKQLGVSAVVAQSFAGLFYRNALNLGLATVVCPDAHLIQDGASITVDAERGIIYVDDVQVACEPVPDFLMAMVRDGGLVPHLEKKLRATRAQEGNAA